MGRGKFIASEGDDGVGVGAGEGGPGTLKGKHAFCGHATRGSPSAV